MLRRIRHIKACAIISIVGMTRIAKKQKILVAIRIERKNHA